MVFRVFKGKNFIKSPEGKTFWLVLLTTIPAVILGKLVEGKIETALYHPLLVAFNMGGFAVLFYGIEKISKKSKTINDLNVLQALFIGVAQALAIIPRISHSAITMVSGLLLGLKRENTVRFSFFAGLFAIHFLTKFIIHHSFNIFIIYRLLISLLIISIILV